MKKEFLSTINDKKYNKRNRKRKIKRKNMPFNKKSRYPSLAIK